MSFQTTIELFQDSMKFSAGHFTIFSATRRENLHGHNFTVYTAINAIITENGMAFDYDIYKDKLRKLCKSLTHVFLLAGKSPYSYILEEDNYFIVHFNNEQLPFLKRDALILPLTNITVEELAMWFLQQLTEDKHALEQDHVQSLTVKIFSAPGQCGSATWMSSSYIS